MAQAQDKFEILPLDKIVVDPKENARLSIASGDSSEDRHDFDLLVDGIRAKGQDTPVMVRPVKGGKYELVAGYRRVAAIAKIAETDGVKAPTVKAIVRDMSDDEKYSLNMRENTERDNLRVPDVAFGVGRMIASQKERGTYKSTSDVARELGLSQSYVSKLEKIAGSLDSKLFKAWREERAPRPYLEVWAIAQKPKAEQDKAWNDGGGNGNKSDNKSSKKVEKAAKTVARFAEDLGYLAAIEAIKLVKDPSESDWKAIAIGLTDSKAKRVWEAGRDSYVQGWNAGVAALSGEDESEE